VYIVGGHISRNQNDKGNVFSIPSSENAEFNMFLDPLAAKTVFDSSLNITLFPLGIQHQVSSFPKILERLRRTKKTTPEALFACRLLSRLYRLQQLHHSYHHMVMHLI
jgi:inosine-uridine nucleoside N-ribohydrolase